MASKQALGTKLAQESPRGSKMASKQAYKDVQNETKRRKSGQSNRSRRGPGGVHLHIFGSFSSHVASFWRHGVTLEHLGRDLGESEGLGQQETKKTQDPKR